MCEDMGKTTSGNIELRTFHEAVSNAGHSIYWTDQDGVIEYVNPAFEEQTGYTAEEAIGRNANLLQSGVHDDGFYENIWNTILDGETWHGEIVNERKDGERYVVKQTIAPIQDETGAIERFVAVNEEITQLREYQEALERERTRVASLFDAVPAPLVFVDFEGEGPKVQRVNQAFEEKFGLSEEDLIGSNLDAYIASRETQSEAVDINEALQAGETITQEVTRTTADGETKTFLLEAVPLNDGSEALGTYTDITSQKRTENKQRLLTKVSQAIGEAETFEAGLERTLDAMCSYTDWAYGEAWQPNPELEHLECVVACTCESELEPFATASREVTFAFGEGLPGRVYASGSPEWIPDVSTEPTDVFHRRDEAAEYGVRAAFGVPLRANDEVIAVLTFFLREHRENDDEMMRDVTDVVTSLRGLVERKAYEQRLEEQRDQLEILNEILRHDIRNDLQLVQAYAELAEEHVDDEVRDHLAIIQEQSEDAVELTRTARELAHVLLNPEMETDSVSLKPVIQDQIDEIRSSYPAAVVSVDGSLPHVEVVGTEMLSSAFRNLLQNAIVHNDKDVAKVWVNATAEDGAIEVAIADNGPGIPDAQKDAVFGKGEKGLDSDGTGIGLYLVKEIVEACNGAVWIEDNDPEGSVFVVQLPRSD